MSARRFDLPLESTAASRFLSWIVGALLYLAVVALAIAAVADGAFNLYAMRARLVTVTLPPVESNVQAEDHIGAALAILQRTRGVTSASPVPADELRELIQPWLGDDDLDQNLPLPRLIDVTLDPAARPDLAALQEELREVVPGATIGVEALSRDRAERLAAFFRVWAGTAGVVLLLALLVAVAVITRMSLGMHLDTIELLRLMGAPDGYLARQFERHALISAVGGGLAGFLLGIATTIGLLYSSRQMELAGSIELGLRPVDWILLACIPVVAALLVTAVARITALRCLARTP